MNIDGISATDPFSLAQDDKSAQGLDKDAFLNLLVNQLKNQDPLEPIGNQDFIAQLAQFSSLEEMQGVNDNLVSLALLQQNNALMAQLTDGSALIGKTVEYADPTTGAAATGEVNSVRMAGGGILLNVGGRDIPLEFVNGVTDGTQPLPVDDTPGTGNDQDPSEATGE